MVVTFRLKSDFKELSEVASCVCLLIIHYRQKMKNTAAVPKQQQAQKKAAKQKEKRVAVGAIGQKAEVKKQSHMMKSGEFFGEKLAVDIYQQVILQDRVQMHTRGGPRIVFYSQPKF